MRQPARYEAKAGLLPLHGFVIAKGERFTTEPLTARESEIVRAAIGRKLFAPKLCFHNAQKILFADASGRLTYVEGFAGKLHHGWLAIGGKVVDPTLGACRELDYFGVRFSLATVKARTSRRCASLLDDWQSGWPVIREPSAGWPGWSPKAPHDASGKADAR
jgi:hypothetical protein